MSKKWNMTVSKISDQCLEDLLCLGIMLDALLALCVLSDIVPSFYR